MVKGWLVELVCIEKINSTHIFLCEQIKKGHIKENFALYALEQSSGVGSRDNAWESSLGNLHLSFCMRQEDLSKDLPLASMSIYFAFILKELLAKKGSKLWLKWPNDFYLEDKKIGGAISTKIGSFVIFGVGINLKFAPLHAGLLDINIDLKDFIEEYLKEIEKKISWKQIFSKYMLEFERSKKYKVHHEGRYVPLAEALLYEDGSILLENKRVYSLR